MSIPLDRLYHHIKHITQEIADNIIIYRFYPHGSKKIEDLSCLEFEPEDYSWADWQILPSLICHDQEPLDYSLYANNQIMHYILNKKYAKTLDRQYNINMISEMNLRAAIYYPLSCYDLTILTHSEKNSSNLKEYESNGFVGVYWWCHAAIARDWFRYAEHITQKKKIKKTFLIYNRAWSGTREYRLKFTEHLLRLGLENNCKMSINPIEPELGIHYKLHKFSNPIWRPAHVLENYFPKNNAKSHYSADFDINDYESTDIEVVLETLFDDSRWHLTEKTLRPIALGQPFILAGTCGSLEYLRSYGFKTFGHIWDESYDLVKDPQERLTRIADLMKQISTWQPQIQERKMIQAQAVADYNKQLFFSQSWQDSILQEYRNNLQTAWNTMQNNRTGKYFVRLRELAETDVEWAKILNSDLTWRTQADVQRVANWIRNPT